MLRIPRTLDDDGSCCGRFGEKAARKIVQGGQHELFELLLQGDAVPADGGTAVYPKSVPGSPGAASGRAGARVIMAAAAKLRANAALNQLVVVA
jgi:hypothetical protein